MTALRPVIERIEIHPAELPMARAFVHAGQRRTRTASVLVAVVADGVTGWGEGAPRPYVTNETMGTAVEVLRAVEPVTLNGLIDFADFSSAMRDLARIDLAGRLGGARRMPAAAAGLELALFDLVCRMHGADGFAGLRQVPRTASLLKRTPAPAPVSFVVDLAADPLAAIERLAPESIDAIRHVKVKAAADVDSSLRRIAAVRERFGPAIRISVDVNGAWERTAAVRAASRLSSLGVAWLEEPVSARDWHAMRDVRETGGMPVMLDESCVDISDLDKAMAAGAVDYVNARISKCGGIFPALDMISAARRHGCGVQLGVQVGEVGPLWAAARLLSCSVDSLVTAEAGKQDEWFPVPLTEPGYFVDRNKYVVEPLPGAGIGAVPNETLLRQVRKPEVLGGPQ